MSAVSPLSVTEVAVGVGRVTAVPAPGVPGGTEPWARRTITAARSASAGLLHDRPMLLSVRVPAVSPVTGPGGVVSAGGGGVVVCGVGGGGGSTGGVTGLWLGAGVTGGGKLTWMVAVLPARTFTLPGDTVAPGACTL